MPVPKKYLAATEVIIYGIIDMISVPGNRPIPCFIQSINGLTDPKLKNSKSEQPWPVPTFPKNVPNNSKTIFIVVSIIVLSVACGYVENSYECWDIFNAQRLASVTS